MMMNHSPEILPFTVSRERVNTLRRLLLFLFFCSASFHAMASIQDNLQQLLKKSSGSAKAVLLARLSAVSLENGNRKDAFAYGKTGLQFSSQLHDYYGEALALNALGSYFRDDNQNDSAITYFQRALAVEQKTDSLSLKGEILNNYGTVYLRISQYDHALNYFQQANQIGQELNNYTLQAKSLNYCGQIYYFQGIYDKALATFLQAQKFAVAMRDKHMLAQMAHSIGVVYLTTGQYQLAKTLFEQSLSLYLAIEDKKGIALSYSSIGDALSNEKQYVEANTYYVKALPIYEKLGNKYYLSVIYNNMADNDLFLNEYQQAKTLFEHSLQLSLSIQDVEGVCFAHINLGKTLTKLHDWKAAAEHLEKGLNIALKNKLLKPLELAYKNISEMDEASGNYQAALNAYKQYAHITDSITNKKVLNHIAELQTQYNTEDKILQINLQQMTIRNQRNILWGTTGASLILLCVIAFVVFLWQKRNVAYRKLVALNQQIAEDEIKITAPKFDETGHEEEMVQHAQSALNPELKVRLIEQIYRFMVDQQPYLRPNFSQDDLAKALDTNRTYLSRVINEEYKCSFTRMVNDFRIREACRIMAHPEYDRAIKVLYEKVGFTSQSAFYDAFKIKTGTTPSFYCKQIRNKTKSLDLE